MNYLPPRDMDPPYGPDLSEAAEEALTAHRIIQAEIFSLIVELKSSDGMTGIDRYDDLLAALEDVVLKPTELESVIYELEADRVEDERLAEADYRYDMRRDEEGV